MTIFLPEDVVNIIADFHDYQKYCKPIHKKLFQPVVDDIIKMGAIMDFISPTIAYNCWGPGSKYLEDHYNFWPEENDNHQEDTWSDDEENNFGLDYDDAYYYQSE